MQTIVLIGLDARLVGLGAMLVGLGAKTNERDEAVARGIVIGNVVSSCQ